MRMRHGLLTALAAAALTGGCAGFRQPMELTVFPDKIATFTCDHGAGVCKIKVYAGVGAGGRCEIKPQYEEVRIKPGQKPKMSWVIDPVDHPHPNPYDYQFVLRATTPPVNGIKIIGNDPLLDFDAPGYDTGGKASFKWQNKHGQAKSFDYAILVERSPKNQDTWSDCQLLDPRMVNE